METGKKDSDAPWSQFDPHQCAPDAAMEQYREMRFQCPVAHSDALGGYYILTRYEDVRAAASDWKTFSSAKGVLLPRGPGLPLLEDDPPDHTFWRPYADALFSPKQLRAFEPKIAALTRSIIGEFSARGECDLVRDFAEQLPVAVIASMVGWTDGELGELRRMGVTIGENFGDPEKLLPAWIEFAGHVIAELEKRNLEPRADFLTTLAQATRNGAPIPLETLVGVVIGLLVAGHETTTAALASLMCRVLPNAELRRQVVDDRKLLSGVVEETLRLDPPFHYFHRTSTKPVNIRGIDIPAESDVMLNWAAANRDPGAFEDADAFWPTRPPKGHLTFGHGIHACAGAGLARLEMRVAFTELLRLLPDIQLAGEPSERRFSGGVMAHIPSMRATFTAR